MPLDTSNISSSAFNSLNNSDYGRFNTLTRATAINRGAPIALPCDLDIYLPMRKSWYGTGVSDSFRRDLYYDLMDACLTGKAYKVFLHELGIYYVAIPDFTSISNPRKFDVLPEPTNVITMKQNIESRSKADFLVAGNGPWFNDSIGRPVIGPAYSEGSLQTVAGSIAGNNAIMYVQWNSPNTLVLGTGEATGGDGFSSLPPLIRDGAIQDVSDIRNNPGIGRHIFAYNPTRDLVFIFVREHDVENTSKFNIDEVAEMLFFLGFEKAAFFDGSTSVLLYEYNHKGKGRYLIDSLTLEKNGNLLLGGLDIVYGIKKNNTGTTD